MKKKKEQHGIDLEEIRPHCFFVRDARAHAILKGEGDLRGTVFELTSWRREGLLVRLQANGFRVQTLDDQIAALPALPPAQPVGSAIQHPVRKRERYSSFDARVLAWVPIEPQPQTQPQPPTVLLHIGWVVRRRQGRGPPAFYHVADGHPSHANLVPLTETRALLHGYALGQLLNRAPLPALCTDKGYLLPNLPLPPPYYDLLRRICQQSEHGWLAAADAWPLAHKLYARLGIALVEHHS